jgi:hypothetical protein
MAKKSQFETFLPIIAIGGVIWFLSRSGMARANDVGTGGVFSPPTPKGFTPKGSATGGPATVGGDVGVIGLNAAQGELGLMSHLVERENGSPVGMSVTWTNSTTDFEGNPISWPCQIIAELGHSTAWGLGGWDNMNSLLGGSGGEVSRTWPYGAANGSHVTTLEFTMGNEPNPPKDWDVRVRLFMQGSTSAGEPDGNWTEVARDTHEKGVRSIVSEGPSSLAGSISGIQIWGDDADTVYADTGYYEYYQPSAGMGNTMRRLGMKQQRPPWGMDGHPDVRQWPRSNRDPNLPGVEIMVRQGGGTFGKAVGPGRWYAAV